MTDLTSLADDDLDALRADVANEIERRNRLASAPAMVAQIATRYAEDGGDPADLVAAVTTPADPGESSDPGVG